MFFIVLICVHKFCVICVSCSNGGAMRNMQVGSSLAGVQAATYGVQRIVSISMFNMFNSAALLQPVANLAQESQQRLIEFSKHL